MKFCEIPYLAVDYKPAVGWRVVFSYLCDRDELFGCHLVDLQRLGGIFMIQRVSLKIETNYPIAMVRDIKAVLSGNGMK